MNSRSSPPEQSPVARVPELTRPLPRAALPVPVLGFGAAAIGNLYATVDDEVAHAAVEQALRCGIRYFDTAPYYGYGLSERRLGDALASAPIDGVLISTKVGRLIAPAPEDASPDEGFAVRGWRAQFDYSRDGILRSFESSLRRLRRAWVDIVLLHDVGRETHGEHHEVMLRQALEEALPAMHYLKSTGACRAIGIGVNELAVCLEIMPRFDLDCILLAGRYTLLEQNLREDSPAGGVLAEAERRGVGVLVGGPFNSGLLAHPQAPGSTYNYRPVDGDTLRRAEKIYTVCGEAGLDVGAAALQFPLAHPAVVSVVTGMRSPEEVTSAVKRISAPIPASAWAALRGAGILAPGVPTP